jgi:chromosome partitioning protein
LSKVISICNQKGGVGKTTTAINLSAFLSSKGKKTLLIDCDPQGNATSGIGVDKKNIKYSTYDIIMEHIQPKDAIIPAHNNSCKIDNLFIIPSNINLVGAEIELVSSFVREFRIKNALLNLNPDYDFIILDCPPSLGLLTINALAASNSILIPLQCEYFALEGIVQLMETIQKIKHSLNPSLEIEGVLLTMADLRTKFSTEVINDVKKYFTDKVYNVIIPRTIRLSEAPSFGKPIGLYDSSCIGAIRYEEFGKEFLERIDKTVDGIL